MAARAPCGWPSRRCRPSRLRSGRTPWCTRSSSIASVGRWAAFRRSSTTRRLATEATSRVEAALPYLQDLGVTLLHLTPLADSPSAHRYDARNPLAVDPALGGERALALLIERGAARHRSLADLVHTHVHRDFCRSAMFGCAVMSHPGPTGFISCVIPSPTRARADLIPAMPTIKRASGASRFCAAIIRR